MKTHENSFTVVDEQGNHYRSHNFVDTVDQHPAEDLNATLKVLHTLVANTGEEVQRLKNDIYELVKRGLTVQSYDQIAP